MATSPQFVRTVQVGKARLAAANTTRDGSSTTNMVTVATGGEDGTRISKVRAVAISTTTAGMLRLFLADDDGTPVIDLLDEIPVAAVTPSGTVAAWSDERVYQGEDALLIPPNWTLRATTHNAEAFRVFAFGGDF